jgi:hypothetical protein
MNLDKEIQLLELQSLSLVSNYDELSLLEAALAERCGAWGGFKFEAITFS